MHGLASAILLALFPLSAFGIFTPPGHIVLEKRGTASSWIQTNRLDPRTVVPVRIGLTGSNLDREHEFLLDVSDPLSSNYGKHWTAEQVNKVFAPSETTVNTASAWLAKSGIATHRIGRTNNGGALTFDATIGELERLLKTEYHLYRHSKVDDRMVGCEQYHVPVELKRHIGFISPGIGSSIVSSKRQPSKLQKREDLCIDPFAPPPNANNWTLENCWESTSPQCFKALYGVPETPTHVPSNSLGIFAFNVTYVQSDMDIFFRKVAPEIPMGTTANNVLLNGVKLQPTFPLDDPVSLHFTVEADLDFQLAWPLIYPENVTLYGTVPSQAQLAQGSGNFSDLAYGNQEITFALEDLFSSFDGSFCYNSSLTPCGGYEAPTVLSISYGTFELEMSEPLARSFCNEAMKLGLMGMTILIASGDGGVSTGSDSCRDGIFNPNSLAGCPWVTSVGATMLLQSDQIPTPSAELAAAQPVVNFSSSGGFVNYFPAPSYQKDAVSRYFYNNAPQYPSYTYNGSISSIGANGGVFNRIGRAFPDVSALGTNITLANAGCITFTSGTSASTPILATVIWRINAERMAVGKRPVGFINPVLYANPQVLNDVTSGKSTGCSGNSLEDGWEAVVGWDPVTGLGTPSYDRMLALFMSLP